MDFDGGNYTWVQMALQCQYNSSGADAVTMEMDSDFETDSISLPDGLMSGMPFVPVSNSTLHQLSYFSSFLGHPLNITILIFPASLRNGPGAGAGLGCFSH